MFTLPLLSNCYIYLEATALRATGAGLTRLAGAVRPDGEIVGRAELLVGSRRGVDVAINTARAIRLLFQLRAR